MAGIGAFVRSAAARCIPICTCTCACMYKKILPVCPSNQSIAFHICIPLLFSRALAFHSRALPAENDMYLILPGPITAPCYTNYIGVSSYTHTLSNQQEIHHICHWLVCFVYTYKRPFMSETGACSASAEVADCSLQSRRMQKTKQLPSVCISCRRHTCIHTIIPTRIPPVYKHAPPIMQQRICRGKEPFDYKPDVMRVNNGRFVLQVDAANALFCFFRYVAVQYYIPATADAVRIAIQ